MQVRFTLIVGGERNKVVRLLVQFYRRFKGAVSRNSAKLGNYKMPVKLKETQK